MGNTREIMRHEVARTAGLFATLVAAFAAQPSPAAAQWSRTYEQFYLPGDFNWTFRRTYPGAIPRGNTPRCFATCVRPADNAG